MPDTSTRIVAFRLTPKDARRLDALAGRHGLSLGEMARAIVIQYLDDAKHEQLLQMMELLSDSVLTLQAEFHSLKDELHGHS